ncbi:MAG: hypothetical protein JSU63_02400 [Phycisphaerales bacterium]|nr:MAG: hypothetical protein JSU63_02400 [Phycisphaerales bacterium]
MLKSFIIAYPWDLVDEGVDTVLDRLHGEIGVSGLSVWASVPPVTQLRLRDVEPRILRTRGGLCFQPSDNFYADTRAKPIVSEWAKTQNPLHVIAAGCAERGLELRLRVSAAATGRLATEYPEMACKNIFGDASKMGVCLANPDVQAYLCGLAGDLLTHYKPAGLVVTDFIIRWMEALKLDLGSRPHHEPTYGALLSLCFCESCRQKAAEAGVAVDRALDSALEAVLGAFGASDDDETLGTILAEHVELGRYCVWSAGEVTSLLKRMTDACDCELLLHRNPGESLWRQSPSIDCSVPAAVVTSVDDPGQLEGALGKEAQRNELSVPASFAIGSDSGMLVRVLSRAGEIGYAGAEIDNYGLLPDAAFTPIKQAARFAKRTTKV